MKNTQKNSNFIGEDGLVHNIYFGDQTVSTLKKGYDELTIITNKLKAEGKPILVLTDITKLGSINLQARTFAVKFIKEVDFDKVAIFGNIRVAEHVVNFIILASGRGFKIKYFSKEDEAKDWLISK